MMAGDLQGVCFGKINKLFFLCLIMAKVKRVVKRKGDSAGIFVPAGVLIGVGLGMFYGQTAVGALVGLGIGFLLMALFRLRKR